MLIDTARAIAALQAIPPDVDRDSWVRAGMAAHAAGLDFDDFNEWSAGAGNYSERDARDTWRSFKPGKGINAGTLFHMAAEHGGRLDDKPQHHTKATHLAGTKSKTKVEFKTEFQSRPRSSLEEVWSRCEPADHAHPYILAKKAQGVPLEALRVLPADDSLMIQGERMAGALVVPVTRADGTYSSLQFVASPDVATRLKARGKPGKLNLPGFPVEGWFTVGQMKPGAPTYVVEGIGTAWACWLATGAAAVVCFGAGNMRKVASELRQADTAAQLVLVPDVGKEKDATAIALDVSGAVACLPMGWERNSDAGDYGQHEGAEALAALLQAATAPAKPEPRYKLLSGADLAALPPVQWRVRGIFPAVGLAALYGPSASGKSFLALDMAAAIAEGHDWFNKRVEAAPVVYAALEGEIGFKLRAQAWEAHKGRPLPEQLHMLLQPFKLTEPQDVEDLAAVVPLGAVVMLDTLNRAAPTADENSSKDMGEILSAAKELQARIQGLVVLVHHTGKDTTKGLRGHSSLFAALDAAVAVSRDGDRREWTVAKAKDGRDGDLEPFNLETKALGLDEYGDMVTSCVVAPDAAPREVRAKLAGGSNQRLILDALAPLFRAGATGKPGAPPVRPCITLDAAVTMAASRLITVEEKRKPERAKKAIQDLVAKKLLGYQDGWLWLV